jgi:hypothetical protein
MATATFDVTVHRPERFFAWMAAACALIAFGGFLPTYWMQLPAGTFVGPPLLHIHGALFSAWPLFLLSQALLAANGRLRSHRAWGLFGIALATSLVVVGLATAIYSLQQGLAAGYGDRSRSFFILPFSAIALFAGFFAAAIANLRRPDAHKRYMLLATMALLQAAIARVFFVLATGGGPGLRPGLGPPPPLVIGLLPGLLLELMIVAGIVYDWRTRGRPHPAWLLGAAIMTLVIVARGPVSATSTWLAFATAVAGITG